MLTHEEYMRKKRQEKLGIPPRLSDLEEAKNLLNQLIEEEKLGVSENRQGYIEKINRRLNQL